MDIYGRNPRSQFDTISTNKLKRGHDTMIEFTDDTIVLNKKVKIDTIQASNNTAISFSSDIKGGNNAFDLVPNQTSLTGYGSNVSLSNNTLTFPANIAMADTYQTMLFDQRIDSTQHVNFQFDIVKNSTNIAESITVGWYTVEPLSLSGNPTTIFPNSLSYTARGNMFVPLPSDVQQIFKDPERFYWDNAGTYQLFVDIVPDTENDGVIISFWRSRYDGVRCAFKYRVPNYASGTTYYRIAHAFQSEGSVQFQTNVHSGVQNTGLKIDGVNVAQSIKTLLSTHAGYQKTLITTGTSQGMMTLSLTAAEINAPNFRLTFTTLATAYEIVLSIYLFGNGANDNFFFGIYDIETQAYISPLRVFYRPDETDQGYKDIRFFVTGLTLNQQYTITPYAKHSDLTSTNNRLYWSGMNYPQASMKIIPLYDCIEI